MSHIFNLGEMEEFSEKINLDDLYDKKRQQDLNKLEIFNKLLGRAHHKIKMVGRQNADEQYTWFLVPEVMIGVPKYDQGACIAYILDKLRANKFICKYIHPNMLFISWKHWIPSYVRSEIKKKTGMNIDGEGNVIKERPKPLNTPSNPSNPMLPFKKGASTDFKNINEYIPNQNIVYNSKIMDKLEDKMTNHVIKLN